MTATPPHRAWIEKRSGERLPIEPPFGIGRATDNRLVLQDERVSRRHAFIHAQADGEWWLVDLGSSNGTYVNSVRVSQPIRLRDGDHLEFGSSLFVFRQPESPLAADPTRTTEVTVLDLRTAACWLLVADVEGSTLLSQRRADQDLAVRLGGWCATCPQLGERHRGVINKYLGDGFLAYWPDTEAARSGILDAIAQLKQLQEARSPAFRLVVHHGQVILGGHGSLGEESLSGREVNFVFRMEKLAGQIGLARLLSEPACHCLGDALSTTDAGLHALPGFPAACRFATF